MSRQQRERWSYTDRIRETPAYRTWAQNHRPAYYQTMVGRRGPPNFLGQRMAYNVPAIYRPATTPGGAPRRVHPRSLAARAHWAYSQRFRAGEAWLNNSHRQYTDVRNIVNDAMARPGAYF